MTARRNAACQVNSSFSEAILLARAALREFMSSGIARVVPEENPNVLSGSNWRLYSPHALVKNSPVVHLLYTAKIPMANATGIAAAITRGRESFLLLKDRELRTSEGLPTPFLGNAR